MLVAVDHCVFFLFLSVVSSSLSIGNARENIPQNADLNPVIEKVEMADVDIMETDYLYLKNIKVIENEVNNPKFYHTDENTIYDNIFLCYFTVYVICVVYIRAKTHFRVDYPDDDWSLFSLVTTYRKALAPDGTIEPELRKIQRSKVYENGPLIVITIFWFGLSLCNYDELLGDPRKHIDDIYGLLGAMIRYSLYILGMCYLFDLFLTPPYCYYK